MIAQHLPERGNGTSARRSSELRRTYALRMAQTESFNIVPLRIMANSNVFIAVCSYDVLFILCERHCREHGRVPQNKCSIRGVVMSNKRFPTFEGVLGFWQWWRDVSSFHWIPTDGSNDKSRIRKHIIHTKIYLQIYRQRGSLFHQRLYKHQSPFWADS